MEPDPPRPPSPGWLDAIASACESNRRQANHVGALEIGAVANVIVLRRRREQADGFDFTLREPMISGPDRAVELPADAGQLEDGAQQYRDLQARELHAAELSPSSLEAHNVVTGPGGIAAHPAVGKVAFTGKT